MICGQNVSVSLLCMEIKVVDNFILNGVSHATAATDAETVLVAVMYGMYCLKYLNCRFHDSASHS